MAEMPFAENAKMSAGPSRAMDPSLAKPIRIPMLRWPTSAYAPDALHNFFALIRRGVTHVRDFIVCRS